MNHKKRRSSRAAEGGPHSLRYGDEGTTKVGGAQNHRSWGWRPAPETESPSVGWQPGWGACQTVSSSLMSQICVENRRCSERSFTRRRP